MARGVGLDFGFNRRVVADAQVNDRDVAVMFLPRAHHVHQIVRIVFAVVGNVLGIDRRHVRA